MFTIDEFLNILKYLQGNSSIILDPKTAAVAKNEQGKSIPYLNNILIPSFNTPDTIRLFNFFIDWYASHKTIVSTSRSASDVYSLPNSHIDELFSSFGFDNKVALHNLYSDVKPEFFKDLVELYKIKGTPEALYKVLSYFEVDLIALYEYYLFKNTSGELVFRRQEIYKSLNFANVGPLSDINFDDIVNFDPHWLLTKDQINQSIARNGYGLPSKTPYIGIVPAFDLNKYVPYLSYISRFSQDKYYSGDTTTRDILTSINVTVSYIELYLGVIYSFLREYPIPNRIPLYTSDFSTSSDSWGGINGTAVGNIDSIGGLNDWMRVTCDNTLNQHYAAFGGRHGLKGKTYNISFKYYIPSAQTHVTHVRFYIDGGFVSVTGSDIGVVGEINTTLTSQHTGTFLFFGLSYDEEFFVGDNNIFYIKDIEIKEVEPFICYDGTSGYTLDSVTTEYDNIVNVKPSRDDRNTTIDYLYNTFTRLESNDFIVKEGGAGAYLSRLNPTFKDEIDIYFDGNRGDEVFSNLVSDLAGYYRSNIDKSYSPLGLFILDFGSFQQQFINDVINFFKPYHARMQFVEKFINVGDRLQESIYTNDEFDYPTEIMAIYDFCTGDGNPSFYDENHLTNNYYSREHYDSTAIMDVGALFDNEEVSINAELSLTDRLNYYPSSPTIENEYSLDSSGDVIFASANSVGVNLDGGWVADSPFINDYFSVTVVVENNNPFFFQWRLETDNTSDIVFNNSEDHDFLNPYIGSISFISNLGSVNNTTPMVGENSFVNTMLGWGDSTGLITNNFLKNNSNFSNGIRIGFWFKQPSGASGAEAHIITDGIGFDLYRNATYADFPFIIKCMNTNVVLDTVPSTITDWNFYEVVLDSTTNSYYLYLNGNLSTSGPLLNAIAAPAGDNLYFGYLFGNPSEIYLDNIMMTFDVNESLYSRAHDIFYRQIRPTDDDIKVWWRGDSQTGTVENSIDDYLNSPLVYSGGIDSTSASETNIVKVGNGSVKLTYGSSIQTTPYKFKSDNFFTGKLGFWAYFPTVDGVLFFNLLNNYYNVVNGLYIGNFGSPYGLGVESWSAISTSYLNTAIFNTLIPTNTWHFFELQWNRLGPIYQRISMNNNILELNYPYPDRVSNESINTYSFRSYPMNAIAISTTCSVVYIDNLIITNDINRDLWSIKDNPTFP